MAELAAITSLYPAQGLTRDGERYVVRGEFTDELPGDVGGTGAYTSLATVWRSGLLRGAFRGNDDWQHDRTTLPSRRSVGGPVRRLEPDGVGSGTRL